MFIGQLNIDVYLSCIDKHFTYQSSLKRNCACIHKEMLQYLLCFYDYILLRPFILEDKDHSYLCNFGSPKPWGISRLMSTQTNE